VSTSPRSELQLSRPLLRWLAADPQWRQLPLRWRASAAWRAGWGSINASLAAAAHRSDASALPDPLLVVGPWRSGTTVMHELLVAATGGATPRTWQCMNATAFELGNAPRAAAVVARPMDGLEIRADSPQEDEFALLTLGAPSAYRAFLMPHRLGELTPTLDADWWQAQGDWLAVWERFLRGVWRTTPSPQAPLILKSPNHSFRLPAIMARFPATRVVWMARPAADVFVSNRKMWRAMFEAYAVTAPDWSALDAFLARALAAAADMLDWCAAQVPAEQWLIVRQAQLQAQPESTVLACWPRLVPGTTPDLAGLRRAIAGHASGRIEAPTAQALPPEAHVAAERLDATVERLWPRHGSA
jgi:omega-hydroxy-beta-dihydromenaquinone-9 sulfotransferase